MKLTKDTILSVGVMAAGAALGVAWISPIGANWQIVGSPFLGISLAKIIGAGLGIIAGKFVLEKLQQ